MIICCLVARTVLLTLFLFRLCYSVPAKASLVTPDGSTKGMVDPGARILPKDNVALLAT